MSTGETACTYASLILFDDGIPVTMDNVTYKRAEKIGALFKAANLSVESYWPNLFAKLAEKKSIDDLIINVASAGAAAPVAVAAPSAGSAAAAPAPEEKKEEPKEDTDEDLGFSLFD